MYFSAEINTFLHKTIDIIFDAVAYYLYLLLPFIQPLSAAFFNLFGVELNGKNDLDIQVKDNRFYGEMLAKGLTGFFDSFINGYIECDDLETLFMKMCQASPLYFKLERYHPYRLLKYFIHTYFDGMTPENIKNVTNAHFENQGNIIKKYSDSTGAYSTMLLYDLNEVENANGQQLQQLMDDGTFQSRELIARKLKLEPGMKVLDIGCGFGGLAKHLAERYKVKVTGVTLSKFMAENASQVCKGLSVKIIHSDYRLVTGNFDRITSIEMFEHVGEIHHREYFEKVESLLKDDGLFVFQAHHWGPDYFFSYSPMPEKSMEMYNYVPRIDEVIIKSKGLLIVEDIQSLGYCFGVGCNAGLKKIKAAKDDIIFNHSAKVYRRWIIYLSICAAMGLTGKDKTYQYVFSKRGLSYAYRY